VYLSGWAFCGWSLWPTWLEDVQWWCLKAVSCAEVLMFDRVSGRFCGVGAFRSGDATAWNLG
jgi:hypothetical protein